jgi:hypothetical protein
VGILGGDPPEREDGVQLVRRGGAQGQLRHVAQPRSSPAQLEPRSSPAQIEPGPERARPRSSPA